MTDHEIKAKFEGRMSARISGAVSPLMRLVPEVARAFRDLRQMQCVDDAEREALKILTALDIVQQHAAAEARARAAQMSDRTAEAKRTEKDREYRASGDGISLNTIKHPSEGDTQEETDKMPDVNPESIEVVEIETPEEGESAKN